MKVLIVNSFDTDGGASRAAYRLTLALRDCGIDCRMLVQAKSSNQPFIIGPSTKFRKMVNKIRPLIDTLPVRHYETRTKTLFSPAVTPFSEIVDQINKENADIVHLHWINVGMMRIEDISRIKAPVIWTLHDMWPFTGGCHYDENCHGFVHSCGNCKVLGSSSRNDLSSSVWKRKNKIYQKKIFTVIGLSRWLTTEAKRSTLFRNHPIINLPNPIDTDVFAPFDKDIARQIFNLETDRKLLLFGALGATSDPRKGYRELMEALESISCQGIECIVFGANKPNDDESTSFPVTYMGKINDDITLRLLYCVADVMVVPSLQENLANMIMESLACGTPVVGFNIGGNSDLIDHKENGYLAEPFSSMDLATGIDWILQNDKPDRLRKKSREKILNNFEKNAIAKKYIKLYKDILLK